VGGIPEDEPRLSCVDLLQVAGLRGHNFSMRRIIRVDIENVTSPEASVSRFHWYQYFRRLSMPSRLYIRGVDSVRSAAGHCDRETSRPG
jgi:hypothetical protein